MSGILMALRQAKIQQRPEDFWSVIGFPSVLTLWLNTCCVVCQSRSRGRRRENGRKGRGDQRGGRVIRFYFPHSNLAYLELITVVYKLTWYTCSLLRCIHMSNGSCWVQTFWAKTFFAFSKNDLRSWLTCAAPREAILPSEPRIWIRERLDYSPGR